MGWLVLHEELHDVVDAPAAHTPSYAALPSASAPLSCAATDPVSNHSCVFKKNRVISEIDRAYFDRAVS